MKVKDLINLLEQMPQNAEVGMQAHDYDEEMSDSIFMVKDNSNIEGALHEVVIR